MSNYDKLGAEWLNEWEERLTREGRGSTHYEGCDRSHKGCAMLRMIAEIRALRPDVEHLNKVRRMIREGEFTEEWRGDE